jgi:hypothetical protein
VGLYAERGCFLVRFTSNPQYPGCFTVSRISHSGQPSHIRIIKKDNKVSVADDKYVGLLVVPALSLL